MKLDDSRLEYIWYSCSHLLFSWWLCFISCSIHSHSCDFWLYSHEPGPGQGRTQAISLFLRSLCHVLLTLAWAIGMEIASILNIQHCFSLALDKTGSRAGIKVCDDSFIPFLRNQQRNSAVKLEQWRESQKFNSVILTLAVGGHFNSREKNNSLAVSHTVFLII